MIKLRVGTALILVLFFVQGPKVLATTPSAVQENNQGVDYLKDEAYHQAYKAFVGALGEEPFQPAIHLNLGLAFEANEEIDKAIKAYSTAVRMSSGQPELLFYAYFNRARVRGGIKDIEGALADYQKALEIQPDSKEVKTNIELLWQQQSGGEGGGEGEPQDSDQENSSSGNQGDEQKEKEDQGEGSEQDQNDQQQDKGQNPDQQKDEGEGKDKKKPKPFDSSNLSKNDVRKILEELMNQEQSVRAKVYEGEVKEAPRGKDW